MEPDSVRHRLTSWDAPTIVCDNGKELTAGPATLDCQVDHIYEPCQKRQRKEPKALHVTKLNRVDSSSSPRQMPVTKQWRFEKTENVPDEVFTLDHERSLFVGQDFNPIRNVFLKHPASHPSSPAHRSVLGRSRPQGRRRRYRKRRVLDRADVQRLLERGRIKGSYSPTSSTSESCDTTLERLKFRPYGSDEGTCSSPHQTEFRKRSSTFSTTTDDTWFGSNERLGELFGSFEEPSYDASSEFQLFNHDERRPSSDDARATQTDAPFLLVASQCEVTEPAPRQFPPVLLSAVGNRDFRSDPFAPDRNSLDFLRISPQHRACVGLGHGDTSLSSNSSHYLERPMTFATLSDQGSGASTRRSRLEVSGTSRSQSDRSTNSSGGRSFDPVMENPYQEIPENTMDYCSNLDIANGGLVTPTRRRSENEKNAGSRFAIRRKGKDKEVDYPEHQTSDKRRVDVGLGIPTFGPGSVWLHPSMFKDIPEDSQKQIMSEIEMTNLRIAHPSPEVESPGEAATAQDRLLTGTLFRNGNNGSANHYQYKHHAYELGAPRPRPMTGSGMVFRRRRSTCWCLMVVVVVVVLLAAGISLGVFFGVVRKGGEQAAEGSLADLDRTGNASSSSSSATAQAPKTNSTWRNLTPLPPIVNNSQPPPPPPRKTNARPTESAVEGSSSSTNVKPDPGSSSATIVRDFKTFWHPGDSRVLEVYLSNGTVLQASGYKSNDGTFQGLYAFSLSDGQGRTTRVRFMGKNNLASVVLPDGSVVSLDWSANNADLECKVFKIQPHPLSTTGGRQVAEDRATPTSYLATLQLGVHSYALRHVSRELSEAGSGLSDDWQGDEEADAAAAADDDDVTTDSSARFCAQRLPVKVTKCGGQYPYDGAFVQGEITLQSQPSLAMVALPWKREDDDDVCYSEFRDASPNFFIPLPGYIHPTAATRISANFWRTASRWWARVCDVVDNMLEVDLQRQEVCANMAHNAQGQLSRNLYSVVYDSCSALLTSVHLACKALGDVSRRSLAPLASTARGDASGISSNSASSTGNSNAGGDGGAARQTLTLDVLQKILANASSFHDYASLRQQSVHVKTYAFCPSTQPLTSFEKTVYLRTDPAVSSSRAQASDITAADMVHVNCPGQPEVTYFFLGHAYIAQGGGMAASADEQLLDKVTHRLKVCAICAYEKALSVRVLRDFMSCNDTCTRRKVAADSSNDVGAGRTETFTFTEQSNVYCHEFLTSADTPIPPLGQDCRGTCQSSLEVRFMVTDTSVAGEAAFGVASTGLGQVYLDQVLTCHEGYRSTCKSTFGH